MTISRTFVIQELYELYESMRVRQRNFSDDYTKAVVQLAENINHLRSYTLILEQAGFSEQLKTLNARAASFSKLHQLLNAIDRSEALKRADELFELHHQMHDAYVDLINGLEPKLRSILTNPFDV
ncbi:MAG TPA: hypothetical protein VGN86_11320 [Pyrinomonadaceae bacterium]|nr:hypothetical protein [Pyrinomonadaceae bacterium]